MTVNCEFYLLKKCLRKFWTTYFFARLELCTAGSLVIVGTSEDARAIGGLGRCELGNSRHERGRSRHRAQNVKMSFLYLY